MRKKELLTSIINKKIPTHIAFILDGNGRWAKKRGMPRTFGHQKGAKTLLEIAKSCNELQIKYLTAFVFSTENWGRPLEEINYIMDTIIKLCQDYHKLVEANIRLQVIGTKEHLKAEVLEAINMAITKTSQMTGMTLIMAFNYGAKKEITDAAKALAKDVKDDKIKLDDINEEMFATYLYTKDFPPVDFLIRTSGEIRLSNFLLWQSAYAEMYFPKTLWPDFHTKELYEAISEYQNRQRRFGRLEKKE